jgi:glycosyltransferase involved in cell wall biosynthesis
MKKIRLCIVSLAAYPLLAGRNIVVGGAEVQSVMLARELAQRGFDISFIVPDHGQDSPQIINGIKIIKAYPADAPMGIRLSTVRLIWKALSQADADIYYGFRGIAGIVALHCWLKRKKLAIGISSDMEVAEERAKRANISNLLWRIDLRLANRIITQTKYQHDMLEKRFSRGSVIIPAFLPVGVNVMDKAEPPIVLWVSTIRPKWKQPELFLKLAAAIPEARFQMVGGPFEDKEFYERIKKQAAAVPNLDFVGFVPHSEGTGKYFERASIFVNTSDVEGFPTTFLEAWSRYTPVVSLNIDPDEIICEHRLGFHSGNFQQMVNDVKRLLADKKLRHEMGERGRNYVENEHGLQKTVDTYATLFRQLCS